MSSAAATPLRRRLLYPFAIALVAGAAASDAAPAPTDSPANRARGGASLIEPAPAPARARRVRLIYTCHDGAAAVFSDRPCGEGTTLRSVAFTPPAATGRPPDIAPGSPTASTRSKPTTERSREGAREDVHEPAPERDRCAILQEQLHSVDARMRQGYTAREAARLWDRWREIKEDLHVAHC